MPAPSCSQAAAARRSPSARVMSNGTPDAGERGVAVYSAHRDTHFAFLKNVVVGDEIDVTRSDGRTIPLPGGCHLGRALRCLRHRSARGWTSTGAVDLLAVRRADAGARALSCARHDDQGRAGFTLNSPRAGISCAVRMALRAPRVLPHSPSLNRKVSIIRTSWRGVRPRSPRPKKTTELRDIHGRSGKHRIASSRKMVAFA